MVPHRVTGSVGAANAGRAALISVRECRAAEEHSTNMRSNQCFKRTVNALVVMRRMLTMPLRDERPQHASQAAFFFGLPPFFPFSFDEAAFFSLVRPRA